MKHVKHVVVQMKDAGMYLASANEELIEMLEIILQGILDGVDSATINNACSHLAFPTFGEDFEEYVHELYEILRSSINQTDMVALQGFYQEAIQKDADVELSFSLLEPHMVLIELGYWDVQNSTPLGHRAFRLNVTVG